MDMNIKRKIISDKLVGAEILHTNIYQDDLGETLVMFLSNKLALTIYLPVETSTEIEENEMTVKICSSDFSEEKHPDVIIHFTETEDCVVCGTKLNEFESYMCIPCMNRAENKILEGEK